MTRADNSKTQDNIQLNSAIIDSSSLESLLVRKDGDSGDIFTVDTTNSIVKIDNTLEMSNATSNLISFKTTGIGEPTFITRSAGTKIALYEQVDATNVDYAIGIAGGTTWFSIPAAAASFKFDWFGGVTSLMSLQGDGVLNLSSTASTCGINPKITETYDLGSPSLEWNNIYSQNAVTVSDRTKKTEIKDDDIGLDFILRLRPKKYTYISNNTKSRGFIAQDIEDLCKEFKIDGLVSCEKKREKIITKHFRKSITGEEEEVEETEEVEVSPVEFVNYGLKYTEIIPILVKSVQELESRLKILEMK